MLKRKAGKFLIGNLMVICAVTVAVLFSGNLSAYAEGQAGKMTAKKAGLKVGTYNAEKAFQEHPSQAKLKKATQKAQTELQKARQKGNQQKMQQIQQDYQQTRNQVFQEFEQDVSKHMPEVASNAGVKAVARDVVYTADDVKTKDVTSQLINSFEEYENKKKPSRKKLPAFPK